jgi:hypothetical protein
LKIISNKTIAYKNQAKFRLSSPSEKSSTKKGSILLEPGVKINYSNQHHLGRRRIISTSLAFFFHSSRSFFNNRGNIVKFKLADPFITQTNTSTIECLGSTLIIIISFPPQIDTEEEEAAAATSTQMIKTNSITTITSTIIEIIIIIAIKQKA